MPDESSASPPERLGTARLIERYGIRPNRDFGQNFLLDENLCDVAVRDAEVGPTDVVVEIGPGVGTLTTALARRASFVHAIEIDRALAPALEDALSDHANVTVHWGDAMRIDLAELEPRPTKMVANLPYSIATPVVMESLWMLPHVDTWVVMVQKEVADRWTASVGSALYGAPSVLLALCTEPMFTRPVPPEVFMPRPRIESALVGMRRTGPAPTPAERSLVTAAFAQRRKTLVNALSGAGYDRQAVIAAMDACQIAPRARAQECSPQTFRQLAAQLQ